MNAIQQTICASFVLAGLASGASLRADEGQRDLALEINKANGLLRDGKVDAAIGAYQKVQQLAPENAGLSYNSAVAQYRKGDVTAAEHLFQSAATTENDAVAAKARYNLGNCNYASGLQLAEKDRPAAIRELKTAITNYRSALDVDPADADARANIELASQLIEKLREQQKQQEQQQKQQQQDQQQKNQDQKQDQQQSQDQKQNQKDKGQQEQQENKDQQQPSQSSQGGQNNQQKDKQSAQDKPQQSEEKSKREQSQDEKSKGQQAKDEKSSPDKSEPQPQSKEDAAKKNQQQAAKEDQSPESKSRQQQSQTEQQATSKSSQREEQNPPPADQPTSEKGQQPPKGQLSAVGDEKAKSDKKNQTDAAVFDPAKDGEMTKQEAEKMLQAIRDRDMIRRLRRQAAEQSQQVPVDRDW